MSSVVLRPLPEHTINRVKRLIEERVIYQILSLGGGVQSACLWLMNMMEQIEPRAEFAVFADTMWERQGTYDYLDYLDDQALKYGFPPIMRVSAGDIREDMLITWKQHMPFFTESGSKSGGMLNRQCTGHYKIDVVKREVRRVFGMKQRYQWIGFSMDELSRRNDETFPAYIRPRYPLLEMRMDREACYKWFKDNDHPIPIKSSCVGCPFRSNAEWRNMKENHKEEWDDATDFDNSIRTLHHHRPKKKSIQLTMFPDDVEEPSYELFIHRSISALETSKLGTDDDDTPQIECGGGCHI